MDKILDNLKFNNRVVLCLICFEPIITTCEITQIKCPHCGSNNQMKSRFVQTETMAELPALNNDSTYLHSLKTIPPILVTPPKEIAEVLHAGAIIEDYIDEVWMFWAKEYNSIVSSSSNNETAKINFIYTTQALRVFLTHSELEDKKTDNRLKIAGLLERFLMVITDETNRIDAIEWFVRKVAKHDMKSAKSWLSMCPSFPQNRHADNAYRIAYAFTNTVEENWQEVLKTVGEPSCKVPFTTSFTFLAMLLRANALEQIGRQDDAIEHLYLQIEHTKSILSKKEVEELKIESLPGFNNGQVLDAFKNIQKLILRDGIILCKNSLPLAENKYWPDVKEYAIRVDISSHNQSEVKQLITEKINDDVALLTQWKSKSNIRSNVVSHALANQSGKAQFIHIQGNGLLFRIFGISITILTTLTYLIFGLFPGIFHFFLVGPALTIVGVVTLKRSGKSIIFDKTKDLFINEKTKATLPLKEIHAIQIIDFSKKASSHAMELGFEINIILKKGERANIVSHNNYPVIERDALRLGQYLNIPVWIVRKYPPTGWLEI